MLERKASRLSVNDMQKVALGRSMIVKPSIFLLDEPFSNLDAAFRAYMRAELKHIQHEIGQTMVYVTHDQVEAMGMADQIAVMNLGVLQQFAPPLELYNAPANKFVAGFIGSPRMNFLSGKVAAVAGDGVRVVLAASPQNASGPAIPVRGDSAAAGMAVTLGIRPEHMTLGRSAAGDLSVDATIEQLEQLGATSFLYCALPGGEKLTVQVSGQVGSRGGETVTVSFPVTAAHLFRQDDGESAFARMPRPATA
jgi:multiple sugar transport system ATP-binding protein